MVRVVDEFFKEARWQFITVHGVPVFFAHVIARNYPFMCFFLLKRPIRVAFQIHPELSFIQPGKCKKLIRNLKNQGMLIKGKIFFYSFFLQTICAEFFNIHPIKIKKLSLAEKVSIKI
mgnify:CR=1 FL=1